MQTKGMDFFFNFKYKENQFGTKVCVCEIYVYEPVNIKHLKCEQYTDCV